YVKDNHGLPGLVRSTFNAQISTKCRNMKQGVKRKQETLGNERTNNNKPLEDK
ncbi:unnamed protein product, partial [Didymodactylos carnosus]